MRSKSYQGPALFSFGFRPFFLLGAVVAASLVPVWLYSFIHGGDLLGGADPLRWHIHEMLFGYLSAVITGFLLTAIPNWTGRLPIAGTPLFALVLLWCAGRAAPFFLPGPISVALIDALFLPCVAVIAFREVLAGKNWRNLPVCLMVSLLALANIAFHLEALSVWTGDYAVRAGIALIVMLNALIGGRIVPSFTTNWLIKSDRAERPVAFNSFDKALLLFTAVVLALWVARPEASWVGVSLAVAALAHFLRLVRWKGWATSSSAIVVVLHLAYLWLPIGLALLAFVGLSSGMVPLSPGLHALTVGLMGLMPLAVMTRASLGHTGRTLKVGITGGIMYAMIFFAAVLRVFAAFMPEAYSWLISISGLLWCLGFTVFILQYGPMLLKPRPSVSIS